MTQPPEPTEPERAAEEFVLVHVVPDDHKVATAAFKAGAQWAVTQVLAKLRSNEAKIFWEVMTYNSLSPMHGDPVYGSDWADWLEKEFEK